MARMGRSDRDPLFFPPSKYGDEGEPEEYSAEVDVEEQQKGLKAVLFFGLLLLLVGVVFRYC
jgi:hypothetical protein